MEHYPTEIVGNYGEMEHIWAFSESGPRGKDAGRPSNVNDISNLMLLCPECHHHVDVVDPQSFPVAVLKAFKQDHEDRVHYLTGLAKNRLTIPIVVKGIVAGRPMDISDESMQAAVLPNWLKHREAIVIDLRGIPDATDEEYINVAKRAIDEKLAWLYAARPPAGHALRFSVFALAPIPLLIYLGSKLSDKLEVDLYQRHRSDGESWRWKDGPGTAQYKTQRLRAGESGSDAVLLVNLSGSNTLDQLSEELQKLSIYELTLDGQDPTPLFLNCRGDLDRFQSEIVRAVALIRKDLPHITKLHLIPAVPAPVAIVVGRSRLPKVDPALVIYDRDDRKGSFVRVLELR